MARSMTVWFAPLSDDTLEVLRRTKQLCQFFGPPCICKVYFFVNNINLHGRFVQIMSSSRFLSSNRVLDLEMLILIQPASTWTYWTTRRCHSSLSRAFVATASYQENPLQSLYAQVFLGCAAPGWRGCCTSTTRNFQDVHEPYIYR